MKTRRRKAANSRGMTRSTKKCHRLSAGPWEGHSIYLDSYGGGNTAWLRIGNEIGRYNCGTWESLGNQ